MTLMELFRVFHPVMLSLSVYTVLLILYCIITFMNLWIGFALNVKMEAFFTIFIGTTMSAIYQRLYA